MLDEQVIIESDNNKLTIFKKDKGNLYILDIGKFNNEDNNNTDIINHIRNIDFLNDTITVYINSTGGNLNEGIVWINLFSEIQYGFNKYNRIECVSAYITHEAHSIASIFFTYFKNRYIYLNSVAVFHYVKFGYSGSPGDMIKEAENTIYNMDTVIEKIKKFFTNKEYKKIKKGIDCTIFAKDMLERGIATGCVIDGKLYKREYIIERGIENEIK